MRAEARDRRMGALPANEFVIAEPLCRRRHLQLRNNPQRPPASYSQPSAANPAQSSR
jgi:hypothetical protein